MARVGSAMKKKASYDGNPLAAGHRHELLLADARLFQGVLELALGLDTSHVLVHFVVSGWEA
jgi:hypothetical protein